MSEIIAKCMECKFTRYIFIGGTKIRGSGAEAILKHSFVKGHMIQIGTLKYKATDESHLELIEGSL